MNTNPKRTEVETINIKAWEDQMMKCIRCAYCFEGCPVFKELGWEVDGARGKIVMISGLLSGELEASDYIKEKIFQCTLCKDCVERCSANVSIPDIITAARADLFNAGFSYDSFLAVAKSILSFAPAPLGRRTPLGQSVITVEVPNFG